jgi:hypothetical protein
MSSRRLALVGRELLSSHVHPKLGLMVPDQTPADVHDHLLEAAGELERAGILRRHGDPRLWPQLTPPGNAPAVRHVGLAGRLELEAEIAGIPTDDPLAWYACVA